MLEKLVEKKRVPSTLLLVGRDSVKLEEEALSLARKLAPPVDTHIYRPEGKMALHSVEKMRALKDEVYTRPYQGSVKAFVVLEVEKMWPQSSNSLLKTFEEPSPTSHIILTTTCREKILPTILSRCQTFYIPGDVKEAGAVNEPLEEILSHGPYSDYRELQAAIKKIVSLIDEMKKEWEAAITIDKDLTAYQKEALEKEGEGTQQLAYFHELGKIFDRVLKKHKEAALTLVREARLKSERSIALQAILESLFIKLGYL